MFEITKEPAAGSPSPGDTVVMRGEVALVVRPGTLPRPFPRLRMLGGFVGRPPLAAGRRRSFLCSRGVALGGLSLRGCSHGVTVPPRPVRGGIHAPTAPERCWAWRSGPSEGGTRRPDVRSARPVRLGHARCPRQDSNLGARFRKPMLFPLSYGGVADHDRGVAASGRQELSPPRARRARVADRPTSGRRGCGTRPGRRTSPGVSRWRALTPPTGTTPVARCSAVVAQYGVGGVPVREGAVAELELHGGATRRGRAPPWRTP